MFFSDSDVIVGVVGFADQYEVSAVDTYKLVVEDDAIFCDVAGCSAGVAFIDCEGGHWFLGLHSGLLELIANDFRSGVRFVLAFGGGRQAGRPFSGVCERNILNVALRLKLEPVFDCKAMHIRIGRTILDMHG